MALASGLKRFQCSAAQRLNRAYSRRAGQKRRGTVFADRYHARSIARRARRDQKRQTAKPEPASSAR